MLLEPARENDLQYANSIEPEAARNSNTSHQTKKQCLKETTIESHKKRQGASISTLDHPIYTKATRRNRKRSK
ncbi:hypothetical protein Bca4012_066457 [Brassica carinata]